MKQRAVFAVLSLLALAGAFLTGAWYSHRASHRPAQGRQVLYYVDPMHPAYKSDKPGIAPDCGMQLEPVYADGGPAEAGSAPRAAGAIDIDAERQQLVGVRVAPVEQGAAAHTLRLFGRVTPDETRVFSVTAAVAGTIRKVAPITTGSRVRRNQWLASYFSTDVRVPVQAFLSAMEVLERAEKQEKHAQEIRHSDASIGIAIERMKSMGFADPQIEEIRRTREIPITMDVVAPADGFVLARNVTRDQKFERSAEWFRIADLSRVWILADVSERDVRHLAPGTRASVVLPGTSQRLSVQVTDVLPQFDGAARTLKVRLEAENPGFVLRPDMFVDVEVPVELPAAVTVPVDAVVDTGTAKTVYVAQGDGRFEPRRVETGWRAGDRVEIVRGLGPGEEIVVSGTFLVDSESRMRAAAAGVHGPAEKDPICGMDVDVKKAKAAGRAVEHGGRTHVFCSDGCKAAFEKEPARYAQAPQAEHGEHHAHAAPAPAPHVHGEHHAQAEPVAAPHVH